MESIIEYAKGQKTLAQEKIAVLTENCFKKFFIVILLAIGYINKSIMVQLNTYRTKLRITAPSL